MTREYQADPLVDHVDDPDNGQIAICTSDPACQAAADEHNPDCPIEQELAADFGF